MSHPIFGVEEPVDGIPFNDSPEDSWWKDCIETRQQTESRLIDIETRLAIELSLPVVCNIREELIRLDKTGQLDHSDLVDDWHCTYASYLDWKKND